MPNCDFYAIRDDHEPLLAWLFQEGTCRVYEAYSDFEQPLQRFETPEAILEQFDRRHPDGTKWHSADLQLYVNGASPPFEPRRILLDPEKCGGAKFRFAANGSGLVQLQLCEFDGSALGVSHTNHFSRTRAEAWAPIFPGSQGVDGWDFERITAFSSRLNRFIRKSSLGKLGSRPVLPGALRLWDEGISLQPYLRAQHELIRGKA